MPIQRREVGKIVVDAGDVVCFSVDAVMRIMRKLKLGEHQYDDFVKQYKGIECGFGADGVYGVDEVTIVQGEDEYTGVLIGGPDGPVTIKESTSGAT